jgi:hypothetical protein
MDQLKGAFRLRWTFSCLIKQIKQEGGLALPSETFVK